MHADLEGLLALQERDKIVTGVEDELRALEPDLAVMDEELAKAETELAAARQRTVEADTERAELEGKVEGYRVMQERRRQRLEWVKGAKEASTIMTELDLARTVLAKEEAEWLRSANKLQQAERATAEAELVVEELRTAQAPAREEIAEKRSVCDEHLDAARAEREKAAQALQAELRELYQHVLRGRAPLALYALRGGACGHCFTAVPLNRRHKLQNGQGVDTCEGCGVLIYDVEE